MRTLFALIFTLLAAADLVSAAAAKPPTIHVSGRKLFDGAGQEVWLQGINRAVFESRCTYDSTGFADGPINPASITAMAAWKFNTVRVSLNEQCWLGINGLPMGSSGAAYRTQVVTYVNALRTAGYFVILEMHVSAPGSHKATRIDYLADADHAPAFWRSVATTFRADHGIIFDLVNESGLATWNNPHPSVADKWACWKNGCMLDSVYGGRFAGVGIQTLVNAVRSQGATQPIIIGGLSYNADLSKLATYKPTDSAHQLIASAHIYDFVQSSATVGSFFTQQVQPLAKTMPVIVGELGERNCDSGTAAYTRQVLQLIDNQSFVNNIVGVLGWTWNAHTAASTGWSCPTGPFGEGGPLLIRTYGGTPTIMGQRFKAWFATH